MIHVQSFGGGREGQSQMVTTVSIKNHDPAPSPTTKHRLMSFPALKNDLLLRAARGLSHHK
jgi:hypothetical protein